MTRSAFLLLCALASAETEWLPRSPSEHVALRQQVEHD